MLYRLLTRYRLGLLITLVTAMTNGLWPSAARGVYASGANLALAVIVITTARALPLLITCLTRRKRLFRTPSSRRSALIGGIFQAFSGIFSLAAVIFLPGPLVIVILFTHTLMLLMYMIWRGEIKADAATIGTTVSALIGLSFVLDLFHKQSSGNLIGMALAFMSAIGIATRFYVYHHQMKTSEPAVVGAENFMVALLVMPVILFYQMPVVPQLAVGWWWLALGAGAIAIGTFGQFYAIAFLGAFRYSLFLKLEPMFATIFGALLIGDVLKPLQYFGIVVVMGSLALYQVIDHRRRQRRNELNVAYD